MAQGDRTNKAAFGARPETTTSPRQLDRLAAVRVGRALGAADGVAQVLVGAEAEGVLLLRAALAPGAGQVRRLDAKESQGCREVLPEPALFAAQPHRLG